MLSFWGGCPPLPPSPGFLPYSLLESEGRKERVLTGWEVGYVHAAGPQQGLIAAINTSTLAG